MPAAKPHTRHTTRHAQVEYMHTAMQNAGTALFPATDWYWHRVLSVAAE